MLLPVLPVPEVCRSWLEGSPRLIGRGRSFALAATTFDTRPLAFYGSQHWEVTVPFETVD